MPTYVFPVLPLRAYVRCVRARACPRPCRTHARASVRTYVRTCIVCARTAERERRRPLNTYVRTRALAHTYARAPVALCFTPCVRVRMHARNSFGPQRHPPPARRGTAPHDSHPNLFVSRPSPRTHSDRRSARRCGSSCHALWAVRTHVRTCVYVCARVAPAYARAPGPGRDVALSLRTPVYVRKYVRTYVALHPTLHARACVRT